LDSLSTSIWQDIFGVSNETAFQTIVPALIAILIFIFGLFVKWLGGWNKNHKENTQKRKFIFSQTEVLLKALSKQKNSIEKFIEMLKLNKIVYYEFELIVTLDPKHIYNIGSNEIFRILVLSFFTKKEKRLEFFNSLVKQLDLIDALQNQFKTAFDDTITRLSKYWHNWNENIHLIGDFHDNWVTDLLSENINKITDVFLKTFFTTYHDWTQVENYTDMYVAEAELITSSINVAKLSQPNQYGKIILKPLLECRDAVKNHRNYRQIKIKEFEKYITQLNDIENELVKFLTFYNYILNSKTKRD